MKIYRIKLDIGYVEYIMFGSGKNEPFIQFKLTFDESKAGLYEEDKAKFYCDELNKTIEEGEYIFELEEVGGIDKNGK